MSSMTMDPKTTPRPPPPHQPAAYLYPSPTSSDPSLPSPFNPHHPSFSRSESNSHIYPRPNLIRTFTSSQQTVHQSKNEAFVISGAVGGVVRDSGKTEEEERKELTTKGRKRKRLAKACSACHKNKRRCDGFAPCSNCEFSSRPCLYVNAQGEAIPPPRTPESTSAPKKESSGNGEKGGNGSPEKNGNGGGDGDDNGNPAGQDGASPKKNGGGGEKGQRRGFTDPLEAVDRDPAISAELIDIFFTRIHPYACMFHGPTFQYRLYQGRTSPLLLDSIYALSVHLCLNPTLLNTISPSIPLWARGDAFAERAHHTAKRLIGVRASWSEDERRLDRGTWEETEFVQALYLLSVYFASIRQSSIGFFLLDVAIDILRPTSTATLPPPAHHLALSTTEYLTMMEARNRTFWMLVLHDLCAAANGRTRRLMDHEMYNVPLPGDETQWDRWGGGGSTGREGARRDGLAVGTGNWHGEEGQVGELGHVLRILAVFSDIMSVANHGGSGSESRGTPAQHEHALKSWALSLPRHLRFDENTLAIAVNRLNNPLHTISRSGWLFGYMHAVAECGMFYLQAALASNGANWTAQRQSQAVDNIAVIMDAIGIRGRESPLMLFPLLVVSNWHDHLRSSPAPPTTQQLLLEDRLALWWTEAVRDWGFERSATIDRGLYPDNVRRAPSPLLIPPAPSTALGLYSASPSIRNGLDSSTSMSTSSNFTLPTPNPSASHLHPTHSHRYSTSNNQLPPLRPRAHTLQIPSIQSSSPNPRQHHLPSTSALSDPRNEIKLPPLPSLDPSSSTSTIKHNFNSFKFPSFWENGRREKSTKFHLPHPKDDKHSNHIGNGPTTPRNKSDPEREKRPVSPSTVPGIAGEGFGHLDKRQKRDINDDFMSVRGPVGIAALISAAEEKSRERELGLGVKTQS